MEDLTAKHISVTKRFRWAMAHRLGNGYPGACKNLHGHDYTAEITIEADQLNSYGMVIDFGEIKRVCEGWIKKHLDHAVIVQAKDLRLYNYLRESEQKLYPFGKSPTVENMIGHIAEELQKALAEAGFANGVKLTELRIYETPDSWCDWYAPRIEFKEEVKE